MSESDSEKPKTRGYVEPKFTKDISTKLIAIVGRGNFRATACAQVGITERTLRNWLAAGAAGKEPYRSFVFGLDEAEAKAESLLVMAIRTAALKGDVKAATWMLERRAAKRWGFRHQVEFTVEEELSRILNVIEQQLGSDVAARIFGALADGAASPGETPGSGEESPIH